MKFFGGPKSTATVEPPAPSQPRGMRPRIADLDEEAMLSLYGVANVKRTNPGECVLREGDPCPSLYGVIAGSLQLTAGAQRHASPLGVVRAGDWLGSVGTQAPVAFTATALEPCTLMEVGPGAFDCLAPRVQLALYKHVAGSSLTQLNSLVGRHAALGGTTEHLVAYIRDRERPVADCLASPTFQEIVAGIPKLPVYAVDLIGKLLDERAHAEQVVDAIKNDPALAGMVLKTVNSPYYGLTTKIADYYHALLYLGTIAVYQLVVSSGLEHVLPDTKESREIQAHSHLVSLIASEIARLTNAVPPQLAATIGLLHDVGRCVAPVMKQQQPGAAALIDLLDASRLGARLLGSWGLPGGVVAPIAHQREPEFSPPESVDGAHRNEVAILHLAHLCGDLAVGREPAGPTIFVEGYLAALRTRETTLPDFYRESVLPAITKPLGRLPARVRQALGGELSVVAAD
jgi:HD-like signal output (HDOD) protein/CRP-like cAMP-binding protein